MSIPIVNAIEEGRGSLILPNGQTVEVAQGISLESAVTEGVIDGLIIEGLWGFNDFGGYGRLLARILGRSEDEIRNIGDENEEEDHVSIVVIETATHGSVLRAVALIPTQHSRCYRQFGNPSEGRPNGNFFYNVTFEAMDMLAGRGCAEIGIAGMAGSGCHQHTKDLSFWAAKAVVHCAAKNPGVRRAWSVGDGPDLLTVIQHFGRNPVQIGWHLDIESETRCVDGMWHVKLDLPTFGKANP